MDWKSTTLISGAGLLATWFFSMPEATTPVGSAAATTSRAPQANVSTFDIEREAARLQVRLRAESQVVASSRNPFRFGAQARAADASGVSGVAVPVTTPPVPPLPQPQPQLSLDGIATDVVNGQEQRTAILHTSSGIELAKEGESVAGQYKVMSIGTGFAELANLSDGSVIRLGLR